MRLDVFEILRNPGAIGPLMGSFAFLGFMALGYMVWGGDNSLKHQVVAKEQQISSLLNQKANLETSIKNGIETVKQQKKEHLEIKAKLQKEGESLRVNESAVEILRQQVGKTRQLYINLLKRDLNNPMRGVQPKLKNINLQIAKLNKSIIQAANDKAKHRDNILRGEQTIIKKDADIRAAENKIEQEQRKAAPNRKIIENRQEKIDALRRSQLKLQNLIELEQQKIRNLDQVIFQRQPQLEQLNFNKQNIEQQLQAEQGFQEEKLRAELRRLEQKQRRNQPQNIPGPF